MGKSIRTMKSKPNTNYAILLFLPWKDCFALRIFGENIENTEFSTSHLIQNCKIGQIWADSCDKNILINYAKTSQEENYWKYIDI